jgi:hypothetical protein
MVSDLNGLDPTANSRNARSSTPKRLSGAGTRRTESDHYAASENGVNTLGHDGFNPEEKHDDDGDIDMQMESGTETDSVIIVETSPPPNTVGAVTSQKRPRGRPISMATKVQRMHANSQKSETQLSKHVIFDNEERQKLIAEEARKELEVTEAMMQVRKATGGPSEAQSVTFADVDTRKWPPDIRNEWQAIASRVHGEINLAEGQIEWDISGKKRAALRGTILEITALAKAKTEHPEFQLACTKLLASLRLCHDFFETLGASMTTANELKWAIERPQFQK